MHFDFNFYSSLLLITFSQGLIYSILLLKKGIETANKSNFWLSIFVLFCSLNVAPWMLGFAGWYDNQPYRDFMFYTPFQHLFFIGPLVFFYVQKLLNPAFVFQKKNYVHFIPGLLYLIYSMFILVYDKFIVADYYFYADGIDKDFSQWYQVCGQISMLFYFVLTLKYYQNYQKLVFQISSNANDLLFLWVRNYLIAFMIMMLLPIVFEILSCFLPNLKTYRGSWWFYLCYSMVLFYIAVTGYANSMVTKQGFQLRSYHNNLVYYLTEVQTSEIIFENIIDIQYDVVDDIDQKELEFWKSKIKDVMTNEKLFLKPEFTLTELAKALNTNVAVVSKTINQGFEMNFNDFVNNFRIAAIKIKIENGDHKKSTLLGLAYDCGFNSKATFNRAFRKHQGTSPRDFIAKINGR